MWLRRLFSVVVVAAFSSQAIAQVVEVDVTSPPAFFDVQHGKDFRHAIGTSKKTDNLDLAWVLVQEMTEAEREAAYVELLADKVVELLGDMAEHFDLVELSFRQAAAVLEAKRASTARLDERRLQYRLHAADCFGEGDRQAVLREALYFYHRRGELADALGQPREALTHFRRACDLARETTRPHTLQMDHEARTGASRPRPPQSPEDWARERTVIDNEVHLLTVIDKVRRAEGVAEMEARRRRLAASLQENPDDLVAREALVRLHMIDDDEPAQAMRLLAEGVDPKLRNVVAVSMFGPNVATPDEMLRAAGTFIEAALSGPKELRFTLFSRARALAMKVIDRNTDEADRAREMEAGLSKLLVGLMDEERLAPFVLDDRRVVGIARVVRDHLLSRQKKDGSWEGYDDNPHAGASGVTALVTAALLESGLSKEDPAIASALNFLARVPQEEHTYAVALRVRVWALAGDQARLKQELRPLIANGEKSGPYSYKVSLSAREFSGDQIRPHDNSNTGYAQSALEYAQAAGTRIDPAIWRNLAAFWLTAQGADGGWNYRIGDDRPSYRNMTLEGLAALAGARDHTDANEATKRKIDQAIAAGLNYLKETPAKGDLFAIYAFSAYSRLTVALSDRRLEVRSLDGRQLYDALRGTTKKDAPIYDQAIVVASIARLQAKRWCVVLSPDEPLNADAATVIELTRHLRPLVKAPLAWHRAGLNQPADHGLQTPIALLHSEQPIALDADAKQKITRYLETGGMLIATGAAAFQQQIETLGREWYPGLRFTSLPEGHPVLTAHHQLKAADVQESLHVLMDGERILIALPRRDWPSVLKPFPDKPEKPFRLARELEAWNAKKQAHEREAMLPLNLLLWQIERFESKAAR